MRSAPHIHILGAGVAGLSAAYYAQKYFPRLKISVYEASAVAGGRCRSFFSEKLGVEVDNATHVILGANRRIRKFWNVGEFIKKPSFYDVSTGKTDQHSLRHLEHLLVSVYNTKGADVPLSSLLKLGQELFPFLPPQLKICYSRQNLNQMLIEPLLNSLQAVELNYGHRLLEVKTRENKICQLCFNRGYVEVAPHDIVISALDAKNFGRIFGGAEFDYRRIINIYYRTSQKLSLPGGVDMLGVEGGLSHWLFALPGLLAVTISNAQGIKLSREELARTVWQEVSKIRGVSGAFLPPWEILDYPRATIAQDKANNQKRPHTAQGAFDNLYLAGDWTMKNWPCSLEAAFCSGLRAVKTALK